jgi:hypothetical protein
MSDQEARARLRSLLNRLKHELGALVEIVERDVEIKDAGVDDWWQVFVTPSRPHALGFSWIFPPGDIIFQLDVGGLVWELRRTSQDLDFIENVIQALIAGRVYSVQAPGRVRVVVTMPDGSRVKQRFYDSSSGCLPLPFWTRWAERTQHVPYRW